MTWTTFPVARVGLSARVILASPVVLAGLAQRLGPARDLEDLARDAGLARLVVGQGQGSNDVAGVLGRVVHRDQARGVLARQRLEDGLVELDRDVPRQDRRQHLLRARL